MSQAALHSALAAWNRGELDTYLQLYHPDVVHDYAGIPAGFEGLKAFYQGFWSGFPGSRIEALDVFGEGDRVACRFALSGRQTGAFNGLPPSGREAVLKGITILKMVEGRCVQRWSQVDFAGLVQQLTG